MYETQILKARRTLNAPRPDFTLLELLVVIAVIAILASCLFPALSGSLHADDSVVFKNNLHQLCVGLHLYLGDILAFPPMRPPLHDLYLVAAYLGIAVLFILSIVHGRHLVLNTHFAEHVFIFN